jgi:hypothetical protein
MSAGAFAKVAAAAANGGGNNIRDGVYELMVESVRIQHGHSGECFIAEFRVLKSSANGSVDDAGRSITPNPPGSTCSLVCNLTKHEMAPGNAKAFAVAALAGLGVTEDKVTPEIIAQICGGDNPLRGLRIIDETYQGINKGRTTPENRGKKMTLNKWKPIAQTQSDVQQQRGWLDATPPKAESIAAAPTPGQVAAAAAQAPAAQPAQASATQNPGLSGILPGFFK